MVCIFFTKALCQDKCAYVTLHVNGKPQEGLLSETGKLIIPVIYQHIVANGDYYFVSKDSLWGCFNKEMEQVIPVKYNDISIKITEGLIRVKKNNKWGFVNTKDSTVLDFKYDFACNFYDGSAYVKNGESRYYINKQGEKLHETEEDIQYCSEDVDSAMALHNQFEEGRLMVKKSKGKFGVVNKKTGKVSIPFIYSEIGLYYNNVIVVRAGKKWGAYTDTGKLITQPVYDDIGIFWNNK